jgi:hypothetical protein
MRLKRKVAMHKKTMKEEGKKHKKFGATAKRLGVNDAVPLTNYSDNIFYGNLYLGSENEPIATIFDTSYDWLLIEGENCNNCRGSPYHFSKSDVFETVRSI